MADDLKGFSEETLRRASNVGDAIKEIKEQTRDLNRELRAAGAPLSAVESYYDNISGLSRKILNTQDKSLISSKGTRDALEKQNEARNTARALDIKINELLNQKEEGNIKLNSLLDRQARNLSEAKDQAKILAEEYGKIADSSAGLDRRTRFFSKTAELVKDVRGLRAFSGPFEAAAKAAREQVIQNEKALFLEGKIADRQKATGAEKAKIRKEIEEFKKREGKSSAEILAGKGKAGAAGAKAGIESAMGGIGDFLAGPIWITALIEAFKFIKDAMFAASKLVAELRRDMGITAEEAESIRQRTYDISKNSILYADTQGLILINQSQIVKSLTDTNNALETQIDFTQDLGEEGKAILVQDAILRDNLQLDEETRANITKEALRTGKGQEQITKSSLANVAAVGLQRNIMLDNNKILSKAAKTTGELRSSFHGNTEEIAKGIAKLKLMGLTLEDTKKVAGGLLNFEESISAEIDAELLTGKDINLERARAYALNRDYVNLGKELIRQGLTSNELNNMNSLQLEAQAAIFNMNGDELTDMVQKQEEFNALTDKAARAGKSIRNAEKKSLQDIYNDLKKQQASEESIKNILGDRLYAQKLAEDAQTKFNKVLEQAKETFQRFVSSGSLDKFADFLTKFIESVNIQGLFSTMFGLADDVDIAEYKAMKKREQINAENDPEKKKQYQEEYNKLKQDFKTASETRDKKELSIAQETAPLSNKALGLSSIDVKDFVIRTLPEDTVVGMGGTALGRTDEMVKLLIQQNQHLSQQNTLLADIKDKKSYIGINGTVFGTTQENNSFVVS